jgi:glycosyltransferase involved in cell wall biosynthesis
MIIITDNLKLPFDEGAKIATKRLVEHVKDNKNTYVISLSSNHNLSVVDTCFSINKLLINNDFFCTLKKQPCKKILYIPSGSASVFSCIRSTLLNFVTNKEVYLFALQPRRYGLASRFLLKFMHPKLIITLSRNSASCFNDKFNIRSVSLPLGVDDKQFFEYDSAQKRLIREKHGIAPEKTVLLHVGHIQQSRNLDWLIDVKKEHPEFEIIIIGSTYNEEDDKALHAALLEEGIIIIREYIPSMVDIYNLVDFYVFPVLRDDGAIETPLSVLEAIACNLPVITTRFGSLPDTFKADEDFYFIESSAEIAPIIATREKVPCNNRDKIASLTWQHIAQKLVEIVEEP